MLQATERRRLHGPPARDPGGAEQPTHDDERTEDAGASTPECEGETRCGTECVACTDDDPDRPDRSSDPWRDLVSLVLAQRAQGLVDDREPEHATGERDDRQGRVRADERADR